MIALPEPEKPRGVDVALAVAGFPRARERRRRVRRMYSLLHVDSAVKRQNERLSERKLSGVPCPGFSTGVILVGPGKKRAKAARQACGVVMRAWKRFETRAAEERSVGGRWDSACVRISVAGQRSPAVVKHTARACRVDFASALADDDAPLGSCAIGERPVGALLGFPPVFGLFSCASDIRVVVSLSSSSISAPFKSPASSCSLSPISPPPAERGEARRCTAAALPGSLPREEPWEAELLPR